MGELDSLIAAARRITGLADQVATAAGPAVLEAAQRQAKAGLTPSGEAWLPRKKDGGRALVNAASALSVRVSGSVIVLVLQGPEIFHNLGVGPIPRRQIIPAANDPLPATYVAAIQKSATETFNRLATQ